MRDRNENPFGEVRTKRLEWIARPEGTRLYFDYTQHDILTKLNGFDRRDSGN